ncbi:uncharacterized protein N7443_004211 [Penicillium atrosanguineum]|uniref:Uncharacterized protein n=1 Tax=Penicillium atrosanguineum TaxID=1132637 RepID=A0A9W9U7T2_9EURO|nr:uncharacterized protein N7443_004211 [Penicillium atrosanguineum]KAJ5304551.1 hypothetical protein N7443_004211 [Penicillium atrosanguineum]KAJ5324020.1 hypothetical protein N7476_002620 [Penicillium atrosanguineum]
MRFRYVWKEGFSDDGYLYMEDDSRRYKGFGSARRNLAALRFVNRTFRRCASPWLFRHIDARHKQQADMLPLERLKKISESKYAKHVRQIDIGFAPDIVYAGNTLYDCVMYVGDLQGLLGSYLARFPYIKALEFHEPPPAMDKDHRTIYIHTVVSTLRYVRFPKLEELEIKFPIGDDFMLFDPDQQFFQTNSLRIPIYKVLTRVRHLGLHSCAYTAGVEGEEVPELITPEYATFPSYIYSSKMFNMINQTCSLESLTISSQDIVKLTEMPISHLSKLRCLHLEGLTLSPNDLLGLMDRCQETMRYIALFNVKLRDKTWYYALLRICKLRHLLDIQMEHCGYYSLGESAHLGHDIPNENIFQQIETNSQYDRSALGTLQRQVNKNRVAVGYKPFSHERYHWCLEPPTGLKRDPYERSDNEYSCDDYSGDEKSGA